MAGFKVYRDGTIEKIGVKLGRFGGNDPVIIRRVENNGRREKVSK